MTPRNFFTVVLKILGLVLLLSVITMMVEFIGAVYSILFGPSIGSMVNTGSIAIEAAFTIGTLLIFFFVIRLFLFKTDYLINKLSLGKHFTEEKISIDESYPALVTVASIVTGGVIIVNTLPDFCGGVFNYFQQMHLKVFNSIGPSPYAIIVNAIKILLGYLLITNSRQIANWVEKRQNSDPKPE